MDDLTHLLISARDGDRGALEDLVRAAQPDVRRFCASLVPAADADDATQETFLRAWRAAAGFRGESSARTWLLTIARRVCYDAGRKRQRARLTEEAMAGREARSVGPDATESVALMDLVSGLDLDRRTAFVTTQMLGLSYEEAAAVCDCPVGTIRSRVARARGDLMARMAPGEADGRTGSAGRPG